MSNEDSARSNLRGLVHMYKREGYSMEEICRFTDSDEATVRQLLSEKTRTEQRRETAQKLRDQGLSDFEIASKMGIPHGQVHNLLEPKPGSFRG